ncbi:hypothetical protein [Absidia glauca]|uniref:Uncharacterized protein n=1 Tax=Absidia glauca TaxID=4829 RepID=A0A168PFU2_ABSGL|nr:hypothetical protein [Absidia glauca]
MTHSNVLTLGQACCLVLDLVPTNENRLRAKETLANIGLTTIYMRELGPLEPFALAKSKVDRNPFLYHAFPPTPPGSPKISAISDGDYDPEDVESVNSDSSAETTINYTPTAIVTMATTPVPTCLQL